VVLYCFGGGRPAWKYSVDKEFGKTAYADRAKAAAAAFEALELLR